MEIDASELARLGVELQTATGTLGAKASAAIRKTAYDIEADAKALAPVDTGTLMNSISTDITGDGRFGVMEAEIGPTVDYAQFVEEGTSRMAPQPYMRPAFDRRSPGLVKAFEQLGEDIL
jgi:HK97 gp10 family phage protein